MATINARLGELLEEQRDLSKWEDRMPNHDERKGVRDALRDEIAADWRAREELVADLLAALESIEWVLVPAGYSDADWECPWCNGRKDDGHFPNCQRQVILARVKGES